MSLFLTGLGAAANIAGGLLSYKQQQKNLRDQQREAADEARKQEELASRLRGDLPSYTVGRAARDAFMRSQQDQAGDIAAQQQQRLTGDTLGALRSGGGARALIGGATGAARQGAQALETILAQQQQRRAAGAREFAAQEQQALDRNVAAERELGMFDYGRALEFGDQAKLAEQLARGRQRANRANLIGDLVSSGVNLLGTIGAGAVAGASKRKAERAAEEVAGVVAKEGAKIQETPEEFSHDDNPIDLIKDGEKVGEVTGGELIFNPEQSGKLEVLASEGDTELHKYLRKLFKEFNKKSK